MQPPQFSRAGLNLMTLTETNCRAQPEQPTSNERPKRHRANLVRKKIRRERRRTVSSSPGQFPTVLFASSLFCLAEKHHELE